AETAYRFDLAKTLQGLYELRGKHNSEGAEEALRRIIDLAAGAARERPDNAEYQNFHVTCYLALGELHHNHKRPAQAHAAYEKARGRFEELSQAHPEVSAYRGGLGTAYWLLGMRRADEKQYAEAEPLYRKAEDLLEGVLRDRPDDGDSQRVLAMTRWSLGLAY